MGLGGLTGGNWCVRNLLLNMVVAVAWRRVGVWGGGVWVASTRTGRPDMPVGHCACEPVEGWLLKRLHAQVGSGCCDVGRADEVAMAAGAVLVWLRSVALGMGIAAKGAGTRGRA